MGRISDAREKLLRVAFELIWESSYGSVSVDDICARAEVKKGSFYHFFPSKCDLAVAALEAWSEQVRPKFDAMFSATVPPLERLGRFFHEMHQHQREVFEKHGHVLGCPFASLGCEMSTQDEKLRLKTAQLTERLLAYFESAIADAQRLGQVSVESPRAAAQMLCSLKTGAMAEAKIANDPDRLAGLADAALRILGAQVPVAA